MIQYKIVFFCFGVLKCFFPFSRDDFHSSLCRPLGRRHTFPNKNVVFSCREAAENCLRTFSAPCDGLGTHLLFPIPISQLERGSLAVSELGYNLCAYTFIVDLM